MSNVFYDEGKYRFSKGDLVPLTDTLKIMLVTSSYSPNAGTHSNKSDVTNEVSGTGYSAGGEALTTKTLTKDTTNHRSVLDADDPAWTTATITAHGAVVYKDTGTGSTSTLICYIDFGSDITSTAGTFTIVLSANGLLYLG